MIRTDTRFPVSSAAFIFAQDLEIEETLAPFRVIVPSKTRLRALKIAI
jgi:hypothetical protein